MRYEHLFLTNWLWLGEKSAQVGFTGVASMLFRCGAAVWTIHRPIFLAHLAMLKLTGGATADAIRLYRQIVELDPQEAGWLITLGAAYEASGDPMQAVESYRRAMASTTGLDNGVRTDLMKKVNEIEAQWHH